MPAYLFIGILLLLAVIGLMKLFAGANPASLAQGLRWAAFALAGIGLVLLPFLGRGSLAILGPAVLVPLLMRFWRWSQAGSGHSRPSPGQTSSVGTAWLAMTLDHDSGHMEGTVRRGRFASRSLSALTLAELRALLDECRAADPDSVALLEAYLERTHPDWRDEKAPARRLSGRLTGASCRSSTRTMADPRILRQNSIRPRTCCSGTEICHGAFVAMHRGRMAQTARGPGWSGRP